ncbi:MFS transporter [Rhizobiaceae bacterium BDR2-2]|uniref:MFS transporter n=1 Tax=Ectorhizobium quercum TaxID=2965071 RepID=A0AAE3MZK6_9HYPH|nr:MFS transporter [Ectorhizobium quercum]MCX8998008.1 MFS transporter [Ectorhizobium quercum]
MSVIQEPGPRAASPFSIAAIILSMTILALGNGIIFTYVPYTLARSPDTQWAAGLSIAAVAFGGLVGSVIAGPLIRRAGHARLFAVSFALVIISEAVIAMGVSPWAWIFARGLFGAAGNMNFIITQSWINHAASNDWRGKAMSFFYMTYVIGLGLGALLLGRLPEAGNIAPVVAIVFCSLAILPVSLTRLPIPPAPASVRIDLPLAWRNSPVAFVGIIAAGGLSTSVQSFTPIYAAMNGVSQDTIATLMFVMALGLLFVQYPLGALSDRIDRRIVLVLTCAIIATAGSIALGVSFSSFVLLMIVFSVLAGSAESVYSIASAHANDRADPSYFVPLASTLLIAWSISATCVPLAISALTPVFGPKTFLFSAIAVAVCYAAFTLLRLRERPQVPPEDRESFEIKSAQVPDAAALTQPGAGTPAENP